ncbi:TetR/AcrR family transcriptional regulator [Hypericibacter adhaerens]
MGRWAPKEAMQERILETADRLFYRRGIRAVGVDTVAAEVGISKRTLYNHYASKEALVLAYLRRRLLPPIAERGTPSKLIAAAFDRLGRSMTRAGFRGCAFINAVAELGELGENAAEARKVAVLFKEQRRVWFRNLAAQAGAADPDTLASQLLLLWEGAIVWALVRRNEFGAQSARKAALVLLAAACPATRLRNARKTDKVAATYPEPPPRRGGRRSNGAHR